MRGDGGEEDRNNGVCKKRRKKNLSSKILTPSARRKRLSGRGLDGGKDAEWKVEEEGGGD